MASTSAPQITSLTAIQEMESTSGHDSQDPHLLAVKFRKKLNSLIVNMFTDVNKVAEDLQKPSSVSSNILKCIHHCLEEFPHIFVVGPTTTTQFTNRMNNENDSDQKKLASLASAFTEWLTGRIIWLFSHSSLCALHKPCEDLLVALFQLVKLRDPCLFRKLACKLLQLIEDLITFRDHLYSDEQTVNCKITLEKYFVFTELSSFQESLQDDENLDLDDIPVTLTDPVLCELLQVELTIVTGKLASDITQHLPDQYGKLWHMLCLQIEFGNLMLKKVSLEGIQRLIEVNGLPVYEPIVTYFLNCLEALIEFFCSGKAVRFGELLELELVLASNLTVIMAIIKESRMRFLFDTFMVHQMLEKIATSLSTYGFHHIQTTELKYSISNGLVSMLIFLNNVGCVVCKPILDLLIGAFLTNIGKLNESKILAPSLSCLICQEVKTDLSVVISNDTNSLASCPPVLTMQPSFTTRHQFTDIDKDENRRKRYDFGTLSSSHKSPCEILKQQSSTWCTVVEKLQEIFQDKKKSEDYLASVTVSEISAFMSVLLSSTEQVAALCGRTQITISQTSLISEKESWLPINILSGVMDMFSAVIKIQNSLNAEILQESISLALWLLISQDLYSLASEFYHTTCVVLSIPWLAETKPEDWHDIQFDGTPLNKQHYKNIIDVNMRIQCLHGLALLPPDIAPYWRIRVFRLALIRGDAALKSETIRFLPIYFHSLGKTSHGLLGEIILPLLQEPETAVHLALSSIVGKLSCVLSSVSFLFRLPTLDKSLSITEVAKLNVTCNMCQNDDSQNTSEETYSKIPNWLQNVFLHILQHKDDKVRLEAISNFPSFFTHNGINEGLLSACLGLIMDKEYEVRHLFSQYVRYIVRPFGKKQMTGWLSEFDEFLVCKLKAALITAKTGNNIRLQETIMLTVGQLGQVAESGLLLIAIISLIEGLLCTVPLVMAVAHQQLKELSEAKGISLMDLFKKFRLPICKFLTESTLEYYVQDKNQTLNVLGKICKVFSFADIKSFLSSTLRYIMPYLISKSSSQSSSLLKVLAKQMHMHRHELIMNNFKYVFSHLVRHCSKEEMEKALTFVQNETDINIGSLLRCDFQRIHNELLLHISTHYDRVFSGLVMLASEDENYKGINTITQPEEMANFLQPRLLGFLAFFDSQLLNHNISIEDKKLAFESLISIMELMGQRHITTVRMKVMATLRIALRFTENNFPHTCCRAWNTFVKNVELSSLGPMLNQVMATLLPLLQLEPVEVAKTFNFLIVENKKAFSNYFHDLYFIPEIPEFSEVNAVLKEYTEKPSSQGDFHSLLRHSLKGINHENLEVRLHALAKVKQVLSSNQNAVHEYLLGRESVDPLISQLITSILSGCQETGPRIRLRLAECLGELGAIDFGRLEMKNTSPGETLVHFHNNVTEENFCFDLVQELVRSYLAAEDSRVQDCASYAIQEMLQIYGCRDTNDTSTPSGRLWNRFSPDVKEILAPLLTSKYIMSGSSKTGCFPRPIYGSRFGNTFKSWVTNWITDLLTKVHQEPALRIFRSCSMIIKHDIKSAIFLLPRIMIYALQEGMDSEKEEIYTEIIAVLSHTEHLKPQQSTQSDLCHLSAQTIFSVLDHLTLWAKQKLQALNGQPSEKGVSKQPKELQQEDKAYTSVKNFVSRIPQDLLARASFCCQAYARALMYLELYIKNQPTQLQNSIGFLQKLYVSLDEPDGIAGVTAIRREEPTLYEQIKEHEATGQMQDAFACYERKIKLEPDEIGHYQGLLRCLMGLDQPNTALTYASGLLNEKIQWENELNPYRVEAAWKLASWDRLDSFLKPEMSLDHWNVCIGKVLSAAKHGGSSEFYKQLEITQNHQMGPLSAASMENGAYQRGYQYLTRLHMLTDIKKGVETFLQLSKESKPTLSPEFNRVLTEWKVRQELVQSSLHYQEPILNLHRVLLQMARVQHPEMKSILDHEMALCWLHSAKLARKSGHQQRAYSCLLDASAISLPKIFMEKAKWHWNKSEKEQALNALQKGIQAHFPDISRFRNNSSDVSNDIILACAKAKLLLAKYSEESAVVESSTLITMYREVVDVHPQWEESHFHLAKYFDRVLNTVDKLDKKIDLMVRVAKYFSLSLQYGCKHIYHSMPRVLSLWFDLGTQISDVQNARKNASFLSQMQMMLSQLTTKVIAAMFNKVHPYQFLTAFPQMISRICHSHPVVSDQLKEIIAHLLVTYSQQAMWMMISVSKSSYSMRVNRCQEIFARAKSLKPELSKFIHDTTRLADKLLELSNASYPDVTNLSINQHFRVLPRMLADRDFSPILLPIQSSLTVTLPSRSSLSTDHNPFPQMPVYIQGFLDTVEIIPSLQRPKKITIRGSDGKLYVMMCKPKDDLRKDCRLMEFNNLVNKYLKRDPESRRRQLHIRTYAVVPLNEECGLIEWVPNLSGLRYILNKIYKEKGLYTTGREIRNIMPQLTTPLEQKLNIFRTEFLPRFPPVFSEWFLTTFPDPTAWYMARLAYASTTAVISMVGYILGLGDRHGENILFDSSCGDTVHVDFNCLFNKGENFDWPERVPFRLTHNMVEAMGPTGYEGIFRKSCEVTIRVMRSETDALMSVLKSFVHDPLVEWSKPARGSRGHSTESGEITNEKAVVHVKDIDQRMNGIIRAKNKPQGLPLSVEGQVNYLIQNATDEKNLCQMYVGWAAYM